MAHFARIESGIVTQVVVVNNSELDDDGQESEAKGISFLQSIFGEGTEWVQTSYNSNFRARYAGIGYCYDPDLDEFVSPFVEEPTEEPAP